MKVFLDTNIIVDVLLRRDSVEFGSLSSAILSLGRRPEFQLCMSVISVPTIAYVLKRMGPEEKKDRLKTICSYVKVLPSDGADVEKALDGRFSDIEDAMQAACAKSNGCDIIITHNIMDFAESPVPVMEPLQFLARVRRQRIP